MKIADLEFISSIVHRRVGIVLGREKDYLIDTRLAPVARLFGHLSIEQLVQSIRAGHKLAEDAAIEAMTTNETLFFRDKQPFEYMSNLILPSLLQRRSPGTPLRIWCAACSSGQEPYSLSMLLDEMGLGPNRVSIMATDISRNMVARAQAGIYSQFEIQRGLPTRFLLKHFVQDGLTWRINQRMGERIEFKVLNILDDFRYLGTFDIILCRNLLIYFDEARKKDVLSRLSRSLARDGYMLLGAAETVIGLTKEVVPHNTARALYVLPESAEAQQLPRFAQTMLASR